MQCHGITHFLVHSGDHLTTVITGACKSSYSLISQESDHKPRTMPV